MLKQRVITALILAALFMTALFLLPRAGWAVLALAVVMAGAYEWGRLAQLPSSGLAAYLLLTFAAMAAIIGYGLADGSQIELLQLSIYAPAVLFWLVIAPAWLLLGWHLRQPVALALVGWVVLIPAGLAMIDLRTINPWLLLGIMGLVWMADIAAYFSGKKFGKHKLAPTISPGKTWEGVAGAIVGVSLYTAIVAWSGLHMGLHMDFLIIILLSWLWVIFSVEGDLFESAIKRQAGVKDSGKLLPGHGGMLDRIDALTSTLPLAAFALALVHLCGGVGCG